MVRQNLKLISLVDILSDGLFHEINDLAHVLKVSSKDILDILQKLQRYSIKIENEKEKRCRLQEKLILLHSGYLEHHLEHKNVKIDVLESVNSTNTYLKSQNLTSPIFCVSEEQTHGRGRLGKTWYSPFGRNIYLSIGIKLYKEIHHFSGLGLMVGLSLINIFNLLNKQKSFFSVSSHKVVHKFL